MARASGSILASNEVLVDFHDHSHSMLSRDEGLGTAADFYEIKNKGIVDTLGNASDGRRVMVILPCKIPSEEHHHFDYHVLRRYVTAVLDAHSDSEYYVVYFHCAAVSETGSSKQWLRDLFHSLAEKNHHPNMHRMLIVHPTPFIRALWYLTAPLLLWKFKQKIRYVNTLKHLKQELPYAELVFQLPIHVLEQDKVVEDRCTSNLQDEQKSDLPVPTKVVDTLRRLRKSNEEAQEGYESTGVPWAIKQCVDYLSEPSILSKEDLFISNHYNISGSHLVMDSLKRGHQVELDDYKDPAMVAAVLKQFFREMPEPLFTFDLYDDVVAFNNTHDKMAAAKALVLYRLPKRHFRTLAFLLAFLLRVLDFKDANKTNSRKLAAIFAPLLLRPKENHASLAESTIETYDTTEFIKYLLEHFLEVFAF